MIGRLLESDTGNITKLRKVKDIYLSIKVGKYCIQYALELCLLGKLKRLFVTIAHKNQDQGWSSGAWHEVSALHVLG